MWQRVSYAVNDNPFLPGYYLLLAKTFAFLSAGALENPSFDCQLSFRTKREIFPFFYRRKYKISRRARDDSRGFPDDINGGILQLAAVSFSQKMRRNLTKYYNFSIMMIEYV
jgi:hypothetical protein